jgi:arginase
MARSIPGFHPLPGSRVLLIGSRDLEQAEDALLHGMGVVRTCGREDLRPVTASFASGPGGVYLHFDLDVLDPAEATANQWTSAGGIKLPRLLDAVTAVLECVPIAGFGFGSHDPEMDKNGQALRSVEAIAELPHSLRP